jgi:hypothetical protein
VRFALTNATGLLHEVVFEALTVQKVDTWKTVTDVITAALLTADEKAHRRSVVRDMRQRWDETEAAYCQRFRSAAAKGWDMAAANPGSDTVEVLLALFVDSLYNEAVITAVDSHSPKTLADAYEFAVIHGRAERRGEKRLMKRSAETLAAVNAHSPPQFVESTGTTHIPHKESKSQEVEKRNNKTLQGELKSLKKLVEILKVNQKELTDRVSGAACNSVTEPSAMKLTHGGKTQLRRQPPRLGGPQICEQRLLRPPLRCWTCGGPHIQRNCRAWVHYGSPPVNQRVQDQQYNMAFNQRAQDQQYNMPFNQDVQGPLHNMSGN